MLRHLPSIPTHPLLFVCLLGNSLLRFTPMIQRDLSFYYRDLQGSLFSYRERVITVYHSSCLRPRLLRREKLTSSVGPSIQRGRKTTFFYGALWTAQCIICSKTVAVLKEFNMRHHWEAEHRASNFGSMSPAERKDAIDRLSGNLQKTTSFFRKQTAEADKIGA